MTPGTHFNSTRGCLKRLLDGNNWNVECKGWEESSVKEQTLLRWAWWWAWWVSAVLFLVDPWHGERLLMHIARQCPLACSVLNFIYCLWFWRCLGSRAPSQFIEVLKCVVFVTGLFSRRVVCVPSEEKRVPAPPSRWERRHALPKKHRLYLSSFSQFLASDKQ